LIYLSNVTAYILYINSNTFNLRNNIIFISREEKRHE
jgi:hypothetical protein